MNIRYILSFFEYFFYRVYDIYTRHGEKDLPVFYGIVVLTLFQTINIISFLQIYILLSKNFLKGMNIELWILGIVFLLNYTHFMRKNRHRKIIMHYSQENNIERKRKGFWVLGYSVAAAIFVTYTAYLIRVMTSAL